MIYKNLKAFALRWRVSYYKSFVCQRFDRIFADGFFYERVYET
jgi:hypothetical protein